MRYRIAAALLLCIPILSLSRIFGWIEATVAILSAIALFFLLIPLKRRLFCPMPTRFLEEGVAAVQSGDMNFYLFSHNGSWFAVDSGYRKSNTARKMERLGILPESVTAVFLTHSDFDHTGGLKFFPNATVFMHCDEEQLVTRMKSRFAGIYFVPKLNRDIRYLAESIPEYPVAPVPLPGHTPGHCGFLVRDKFFCTGDSVRLTGKGIRPFFRLLCMDYATAKVSAETVRQLAEGRLLCTAHSGMDITGTGNGKPVPRSPV